jgi:hypothetical protein
MKTALPGSEELLEKLLAHLGPNRLPRLIGIDGDDGVGKSSLASWLAWQLGAPTVHLDLYLIRDSNPLRWRTEDLQRVVTTRLDQHEGPLIIEGMMLLEALAGIGRKVDFLVYLDGPGTRSLSKMLAEYPEHDVNPKGLPVGACKASQSEFQLGPSNQANPNNTAEVHIARSGPSRPREAGDRHGASA